MLSIALIESDSTSVSTKAWDTKFAWIPLVPAFDSWFSERMMGSNVSRLLSSGYNDMCIDVEEEAGKEYKKLVSQ